MSKPQKPEAAPPKQPVVAPPRGVTLAALTERELDTLRRVCRDSDNENGIRALNAALVRGGK